MAFNLLQAMRRAGVRRRRVLFRRISVRPAHVFRLRSIYAVIVRVWEEAQTRILEQYERDAIRFADVILMDSPEDVRRLLDLVVFETDRAMVRIVGALRDWARAYERYHRQEGQLVLAATLSLGDTLTSPLLPGFSLALADLFRPLRRGR